MIIHKICQFTPDVHVNQLLWMAKMCKKSILSWFTPWTSKMSAQWQIVCSNCGGFFLGMIDSCCMIIQRVVLQRLMFTIHLVRLIFWLLAKKVTQWWRPQLDKLSNNRWAKVGCGNVQKEEHLALGDTCRASDYFPTKTCSVIAAQVGMLNLQVSVLNSHQNMVHALYTLLVRLTRIKISGFKLCLGDISPEFPFWGYSL